jgi:hypothetical protein
MISKPRSPDRPALPAVSPELASAELDATAREHFIDGSARRPRGRLAWDGHGGPGGPARACRISGRLPAWVGPIAGERVPGVGCGGGRLPGRLLQAQAVSVSGAGHSPDVPALAQGRSKHPVSCGQAAWPAHSFLRRPGPRVVGDVPVLVPGGRVAIATAPGPEAPASARGPAMRLYPDETSRAAAPKRRARRRRGAHRGRAAPLP